MPGVLKSFAVAIRVPGSPRLSPRTLPDTVVQIRRGLTVIFSSALSAVEVNASFLSFGQNASEVIVELVPIACVRSSHFPFLLVSHFGQQRIDTE